MSESEKRKKGDPRKHLAEEWSESKRFKNYGSVLTKITIHGIRCHKDTDIEIRSPITAFSGLNGTGKSTVVQLAAAAYVPPAEADTFTGFTISSFLCRSPLDQTVFASDASVKYEIQGENRTESLTLSYDAKNSRWLGYERRPKRTVFYGGVGLFLPRSEKQDFVFLNAAKLKLVGKRELDSGAKGWIVKILSSGYGEIHAHTVKHRTRQDEMVAADREGVSYSEAHMGCGEGRVHRLVASLESLPPQSLVLLEEPEISLHSSAEYEFGKYLMDLAIRKHHQILLTTHSGMLLRSLPDASLVFLNRTDGRIQPLPGIGSRHAASLLTQGHEKALTVLVEDEAAEAILTELLRHHQSEFLATIKIAIARDQRDDGKIEASGKDAIRSTMKSLSEAGLKIAAVLDGGEKEDARRYIFALPGSKAPEGELYANTRVKTRLVSTYKLNLADLDGVLQGQDIHNYFKVIAQQVSGKEMVLIWEAAREYAQDVPAGEVNRLVELLKDASQRK